MSKKSVDELLQKLEALQIDLKETKEDLKTAYEEEKNNRNKKNQEGVFVIGDNIVVKNAINTAHGIRSYAIGDTRGVVTRFSKNKERVFFETLNGWETCRAPKNIRHANLNDKWI